MKAQKHAPAAQQQPAGPAPAASPDGSYGNAAALEDMSAQGGGGLDDSSSWLAEDEGEEEGIAPMSAGAGKGPVAVSSGAAAWQAAWRGIAMSQGPVTVAGGVAGDVTLTPGASWGDKLLVVAGPMQCMYLQGNTLYEQYTPDFVKDHWLGAFSKGAAAAEWIVPLAKAELEFCVGFLVPTGVVAVVGVLKLAAFYHEHKSLIHLALDHASRVYKALAAFKEKCPTVWTKLRNWGLEQMVVNFPKGIELEDVAYFMGRLLGSVGLMGSLEQGAKLTAGLVAKTAVTYAALVAALHGVPFKGLAHEGKEFFTKLKEQGVDVTIEDAQAMWRELKADPAMPKMLEEIGALLGQFNGSMTQLGAAWKKLNG